jgi:mono/diheme cytochrome c family protein
MKERRALARFILHPSSFILLSTLLAGCWKDDMAEDAHAKPMEPSPFFSDGKLARPLINGTVPRGHRTINDPLYAVTNAPAGTETATFPFPLAAKDLEIGREQFTIFCAPCHGGLGDGKGMIVQRGFPSAPSYYQKRLRDAAPGHFYNVITHGYGAMYSYAERIRPDDRWRIVGYVRALQLSTDRIDPPPNTAAPGLPATAGTTQPAR